MTLDDARTMALAYGWEEDLLDEILETVAPLNTAVEEVHACCIVLRTQGAYPNETWFLGLRDTRLATIRAANEATAHLVQAVARPGWHARGTT